jgi:hypothetical protein
VDHVPHGEPDRLGEVLLDLTERGVTFVHDAYAIRLVIDGVPRGFIRHVDVRENPAQAAASLRDIANHYLPAYAATPDRAGPDDGPVRERFVFRFDPYVDSGGTPIPMKCG